MDADGPAPIPPSAPPPDHPPDTPPAPPATPPAPERPPHPPVESDETTGPGWGKWAGAGVDFGVSVVLFFLLGSWLDAKWGTSPWWRVAGAGFGVILGMYLLIKKALASNAENPDRDFGAGRKSPPNRPPPRT